MIAFLSLALHVLVSPFKTRAQLEAEIVLLRHQLNVLRRRVPSKPKLAVADRLLFVWLYRLFPSVLNAVAIVQPETIIRWHRAGFRLYWRWKSRSRGGRPKVPIEIRRLIRDMSLANRLWGAPRIHGELLKLGIEVAQSTVAKYMARSGRGRSQTWKTFLHNHAAGIAAPSLGTMRPTISFETATGPKATPSPQRLSAMGIRDHPTAARSPWQNGHAERLIGSIRRECLDHIVVFGEGHLRRILAAYAAYYNERRTHLSLSKDSPTNRPIQRLGQLLPRGPILGGLHHEYCRT